MKSAAMGIALLMLASHAIAGTTTRRHYDENGHFVGKSVESGSTVRDYDADGRFSGRRTDSPHETRYYDANGRYTGKSRK